MYKILEEFKMQKELDSLGADVFERLVQSLVQKITGLKFEIFGDGPDGQREGVIEDADFKLDEKHRIIGRTILQAKYKSPESKTDTWQWLKTNLLDELEKFKKISEEEPEYVPNTWLFFTNITLTPVKNTGLHDKAQSLIKPYRSIIDNILFFGKDDILSMLDNNRDVATAYASFLMPGDIMKKLYDQLSENDKRPQKVLCEYAKQMIRNDCAARMEQAGKLTESQIALDKVYVDLEAAREGHRDNEQIDGITKYIIELGNHLYRRNSNNPEGDLENSHLSKSNKLVLIANAGQGKSTLCQYICQFYRISFLKQWDENINTDTYQFNSLFGEPKCKRFPIHIVLRYYAAWINKQDQDANKGILSYIIYLIQEQTHETLSLIDFRKLLSSYSWLFLFDGLDEVPASSNRNDVLREIRNFVGYDLLECMCDYVVLCTTRPQGYTKEFSPKFFSHIYIKNMSSDCCLLYLQKLLPEMETNQTKREEYLTVLNGALEDPIVSRLMITPLQITIITILVKAGGKPPSNRYSLFKEYYETTVKREKQKKLVIALNDDNAKWIDNLHATLGFVLQKGAESQESADAMLSVDQCKKIIKNYIKEQVDEVSDTYLEQQTEQLYKIILERLAFLCELRDGKLGFSIRSIQEYLASNKIVNNQCDKDVAAKLQLIAPSDYWRNVFLFSAGNIMQNRSYLEAHLYEICQELNGNGNAPGQYSLNSIAQSGSWLALDMLCDNLFTKTKDQNKYLKIFSELLSASPYVLPPAESLQRLPPALMTKFIKEYVEDNLCTGTTNEADYWYILFLALNCNNDYAKEVINNLKGNFVIDEQKLNIIFGCSKKIISELPNTIIDKIQNYLREYEPQFLSPRNMNILCWFHKKYVPKDDLPIGRLAIRTLISTIRRSAPRRSIFVTAEWLHPVSLFVEYASKRKESKEYWNLFGRTSWEPVEEDMLKLCKQYELDEYISFLNFQKSPTYANFTSLVKTYYSIPKIWRYSISNILQKYNWFLNEFTASAKAIKNSEECLEIYNEKKFKERLLLEPKISDVLAKKNWEAIIDFDLWTEASDLTGDYNLEEILELLDTKKGGMSSNLCINFVFHEIYNKILVDDGLSNSLMEYCLNHTEDFSKTPVRKGLLVYLLAEAPLSRLMNSTIDYFQSNILEGPVFVEWKIITMRKYFTKAYIKILDLARINGGSHPACGLIPDLMLFSTFLEDDTMDMCFSSSMYKCNFEKAQSSIEEFGCICTLLTDVNLGEDEQLRVFNKLIAILQMPDKEIDFKSLFGMILDCKWIQPNIQWLLCKIWPFLLQAPLNNHDSEHLAVNLKRTASQLVGKSPINWKHNLTDN